MLQAIAGYDKLDTTSVDWPVDRYLEKLTVDHESRVGIVRRPFFDDLDNEITTAIEEAIKVISAMSSEVVEVDLPPTPTAVQAPEVYAIHAKSFATSPGLAGRPW